MAVRFDAPIYTTQQVLNEAGILLELDVPTKDIEVNDDIIVEGSLSGLPNEDLAKLLEDAVKDEDFDAALEIQEEIKRRKKKID